MSDKKLPPVEIAKQILEAKKRSTPVNSWYVHTEDMTIRGPFCRWLKILEPHKVEIQRDKTCRAHAIDDMEYFALVANVAPQLAEAVLEMQAQAATPIFIKMDPTIEQAQRESAYVANMKMF